MKELRKQLEITDCIRVITFVTILVMALGIASYTRESQPIPIILILVELILFTILHFANVQERCLMAQIKSLKKRSKMRKTIDFN